MRNINMARNIINTNINKMVINKYLSNYSSKRNIDSAFKKWFMKQDETNPEKTKDEWDSLYSKFLFSK